MKNFKKNINKALSQDTHIIDLDWGDPESLSNEPSKPTPYPIDAFTGVLRNTVEKIAYYAQVPHTMAGQCVLGAMSHMGQRFVNAPMGFKHMPCSLIIIIEGDSGCGKSTAMDFSHHIINKRAKEYAKNFKDEYQSYQDEKASLTGKELKEFLATTPEPINKKNVFGNSTIEQIESRFIDGSLINGSWATEEAVLFFNGHTMKGDTAGSALGTIVNLRDKGYLTRDRKGNDGQISEVYDVRLTLFLMGQRIVLEPALSDPLLNGQGFLPRALIALPPNLMGKRKWNDPQRRKQNPYNDPDLIAYWERCKELLDPAPNKDPEYTQKERIKMLWDSESTEQVFYDKMQSIENKLAKYGEYESIKSYASRMAENSSRIATLMAFFDNRTSITTDDITRAFRLVEYSTAERLRYLDAGTSEQTDSEKLSSWLVKKSKGKTPPVLSKSYISTHCPNHLRSKNLNLMLEYLESANHVKIIKKGRSIKIVVNPKLLTSSPN